MRTLTAMLEACPSEFDTAVVTSNRDMGCDEPLDVVSDRWVPYGDSQVYYTRSRVLGSILGAIRSTRRWGPDAIYVNSFFDSIFSILPQFLFLLGFFRPAVFAIAPRGEFNPGALQIGAVKKRNYIRLFRWTGLSKRVVWHASTRDEADEVRQLFGEAARVIIRENDTNLPSSSSDAQPQKNGDVLRVVSLSRLAPKKGVDTLLEGLQQVTDPLVLDVIGPAEDESYSERCHRLAAQLPTNIEVNFLGPVAHEEIRNMLMTYDVMACPTKGENFGHVIAEALSVKCPVMCADVTPWTARLADGGGVVVGENTPSGWAIELSAYARLRHGEILERRLSAGAAYDNWKAASREAHFFYLLESAAMRLQR